MATSPEVFDLSKNPIDLQYRKMAVAAYGSGTDGNDPEARVSDRFVLILELLGESDGYYYGVEITSREQADKMLGQLTRMRDRVFAVPEAPKAPDVFNESCGQLPDGWTIEIALEKGCGTVTLYDFNQDSYLIDSLAGERTVEEQIRKAIEIAKKGVALENCEPE